MISPKSLFAQLQQYLTLSRYNSTKQKCMRENIFSTVMGTFCQNTAFLLIYGIKNETTVYVVCVLPKQQE